MMPDSGRRVLESEFDSSEIRLQKIVALIGNARYSIYDLSRTELDSVNALPRFNMPLELGIDIGCNSFSPHHTDKAFLIFDSEKYRFQRYIADIAGQDIEQHRNDAEVAVKKVRKWLRAASGLSTIPGGAEIYRRYLVFCRDMPALCEGCRLDINDLTFAAFSYVVIEWLKVNS